MKITLVSMDPVIRGLLGWDSKTEDVYQVQGDTIADFFKVVKDKDGKSFYDRVEEDDGIISNIYMFYNFLAFLKKEDLGRRMEDGDKIVLMRSLGGCGAG